MPELERAWGSVPNLPYLPSRTFPSRRTVGLEIECGFQSGAARQRALNRLPNSVGYGHDGSLSCPSPIEIKTPPTSGGALSLLLGETLIALTEEGAIVDDSCGLHVHVGARDLPRERVGDVFYSATAYEDAIYCLLARSRSDNQYAAPIASMRRQTTKKPRRVEPSSWKNDTLSRVVSGEDRYHGLNLHAMMKFGTIEFRYYQGTVDLEEITRWVRFVTAFVDTVSEAGAISPSKVGHNGFAQNLLTAVRLCKRIGLSDEDARFWETKAATHLLQTRNRFSTSPIAPEPASRGRAAVPYRTSARRAG